MRIFANTETNAGSAFMTLRAVERAQFLNSIFDAAQTRPQPQPFDSHKSPIKNSAMSKGRLTMIQRLSLTKKEFTIIG